MTKYLGICAIVFGALVLTCSYLFDLVDYNFVQGIGLLLIIFGFVGHIWLQRRA